MLTTKLFLFDATAFYYRAFYALAGLTTSSGQPVGAVYGFINMLNKVLKSQKAEFAALCFDVSRQTFRQEKFAEYKIQRPPMPEDLVAQLPLIKEVVAAYHLPVCELKGYEADDIIATLNNKALRAGMDVVIVSPDKDILQLAGEHSLVLNPYKGSGVLYDPAGVEKDFGVGPGLVPDALALMGDDSDNIPGVPGIGPKTAVSLLKEFGSLEGILKRSDEIKPERIRQSILDNRQRIELNLQLVRLDEQVPLDFEPEFFRIPSADNESLRRIFRKLEFRILLKSLPPEDNGMDAFSQQGDDSLLEQASLKDELIFVCVSGSGDVLISAAGMNFTVSASSEGAASGENLKRLLESADFKKIGHDLKKAASILHLKGIRLRGMCFDSKIAAYLLNPSSGSYSLEDICAEYDPDMPPGRAYSSGNFLSLQSILRARLAEKSLLKLFEEIEMPLVEILSGMELEGIKVDTAALRELSSSLQAKIIGLTQEIYDCAQCSFNINSPQQLRVILFEKLKLPVRKKTKTGPSTDEEVLSGLAGEHKLPGLLLEYRQLSKLKSTYVDSLLELVDQRTSRIHTSFNQTGTETGRLSSSEPNLQNIPVRSEEGRKIRRVFVASDKDNWLFSCDYSQIELRILAHLSLDSGLVSAFTQDKDIHAHTASLIYGVAENDVDERMRETAKRVNFGIIYGQTSYGLSKDLNIPLREAEAFIDAYFLRYPGVKKFIDSQIASAQTQGFVSTILGRRRYLPEINSRNQAFRQLAERKAINTPVQGSASDLIKAAMICIQRELRQARLSSRMVLQVHDELVFDVPQQEAGKFVRSAKEIMENVIKLSVPLKVSVKKGRNLCDLQDCDCAGLGLSAVGGRV